MITLDADTRRRKYALKRQIAEIEAAEKAERPPRKATKREARVSHGKVRGGDDRGRVREPLYLAFIRLQPCAARALGGCDGPVEAAHVRYSDAQRGRVNPGLQVKPSDEYTLPLCASHHRAGPIAQHSMNERRFWEMVGVEPAILMAELRSAYNADPR